MSEAVAAAAPAPLKNRAFLQLLSYRILAMLSYQIVAVTVGWHIYEITRDPLALGLVGLAEVIPYFCVAPFAGYLVDHLRRRRLGALACSGLAITAFVLVSITQGWLDPHGTLLIYAAIALTGTVRSFLTPIYNTLFARVLPREQFARGAGFGSVVFQLGLVLGPAFGGALVAWAGKGAAYGLAAALALAAAIALLLMRIHEPHHEGERAPIFASIGEGLRFVFGHQILLGALALDMFAVLFGGAVALLPAFIKALALDMFAVLFGGAVALLPAFIKDVLHAGPEALGILRGAPAAGAVIVGLWLSRKPPERNAGRLLLMAVFGFGMCIVCFALSKNMWLSAALLFASGAFDGVSVVLRSTILQLATPDAMRGRVSAINGIFIGSSNELGAFESGLAAKLLGLVPSVIFGGCMTMGIVAATAKLAPKLRKLDLRELH